jgi:hypothetical protein
MTVPFQPPEELTELVLLVTALDGHVSHAEQQHRGDPQSLPLRLNLIRAVVAKADGLTAALKGLVRLHPPPDLPPEELLLLDERTPYLDRAGRVRSSPLFPQPQPNLRFAVQIYARANGVDFQLDTSAAGWSAFSETIDLRNRLTHPKTWRDLDVSDHAILRALEAHRWIRSQHTELLELLLDKQAFESGMTAAQIRSFRQLRQRLSGLSLDELRAKMSHGDWAADDDASPS